MDSMLARPALSFRTLISAAVTALVAICATLALAAPAHAQFAFASFATEGDASAGWISEPNAPPGATDHQSIGLFVNGSSASDFSDAARAKFTGVAGAPPATPPSFDFKVFTVGGSGGSVRFVVRFSDGGRGELRPVTLQANIWTHVDGSSTNWDVRGGSCDNSSSQTYSQVVACHPGAQVTGVEVINDSGWLFVGGFQILVDNVSYGGQTVSAPAAPVLGETIGLAKVSGQVIVRYPGRRRKGQILNLVGNATLPLGSVIDTRKGHARLVSSRGKKKKPQRGVFRDGIFRVKQPKNGHGVTELILRGALFGCSGSSSSNAQAASGDAEAALFSRRRRLWGRGRGSFRTRGLYSSGAVRGTKWLTVDTCAGTLTLVVRGVVEVHNFVTGETIRVRAGHRYFASVARINQ